MMRIIIVLLLSSMSFLGHSQELTANQLLQKTMAYHDPNNNWSSFSGAFKVLMKTPNSSERKSIIQINLPQEQFNLNVEKDGNTLEYKLKGKTCTLLLNGSPEITEAQQKSFNLNCERANMMKDYYTYLYGLPMKLKDPGTIIDPKVQHKKLKNKEYLVLKVTYEEGVGGDTWYFYFDPASYAMEAYQFYHDESKNDGEYILLKDQENINDIRMPKTREWYYNKDHKFLGTDILSQI
ncbi:DUF6503 family protein [Sediminicola sp. 1XM1-17]|uniref:DUF6503 family protein n=1 Tax=Sediminicola sp. 1XM1-17 TaxID=3127702 RepID=UPI003076A647